MRAGVTGSVIAHAAVIVIAIIGLNSAQALTPEAEQAISVDLIPITDTTHVRAGSEKSKIINTTTPAVVESQTPPSPTPGNTSQQTPTPNTAAKASPMAVTNTAPAPTPAPAPPTPQPVVPAPPPPEPQPTPQPVPTPAPPPPPAPKPKPQPKPTPAPTPSPQLASSASTSTDSAPPAPMKTADLEQQRADLKKQQEADAKAAAAEEAKAAAQAAAKAQAEADAKAAADAKVAAAEATKAKAQAEAKALAVATANAKAAAAKKAAAAAQAQQVAEAKANSDKAARAADEISQLINTEQSTGGRTGSGGTPTAGKATGADAQLTASEIGLLSAAIQKCWKLLPSQISSGVKPELDFKLNRDGTVNGSPQIVATDNSDMGQQIAQSARRAVLECQPYNMLPAAKYDNGWSEIDLEMDPAGQ